MRDNLKNRIKENKAITLVALVITIVVLIILATISINIIFGEQGILDRARMAKSEYTDKQSLESNILESYEDEMNSFLFGSRNDNLENSTMTLLLTSISTQDNSKNIGTYDTSNFSHTETEETAEFLEYDSTNKCYVIKKSGWYILNLASSANQKSGWLSVYMKLLLNNSEIAKVMAMVSNNNGDYSTDILTIYLPKGNKISYEKGIENINNDYWNTTEAKIWVLK